MTASPVGSADPLQAYQQRYRAQLPPEEVAGLDDVELTGRIRAHYEFGRRRVAGEHLLRVVTPLAEDDGWQAEGATVIQLVTDDRPFLVESLAMELARQGWSLRRLFHPQLVVRRDAAGAMVESGGTDLAESWVAMEVFSPLGVSATQVSDELLAGLAAALREVTVAVSDWQPMLAAAGAVIETLEAAPQPAVVDGAQPAIELLRWLADDHFVFLGYREYRIDGRRFVAVPDTGLGILRGDDDPAAFHAVPTGEPEVLVVTKDPRRSRVHRSIYLDYIGVRIHDAQGRPVAERRFLGLFAASAYAESVHRIPVLATKASEIAGRIGYDPSSYSGHAVQQAIESCPRDELFQAEVEGLVPVVATLARLRGRRVVKAFVRHDRYGRFVTAQVYLPRDRYNTAVRERISGILLTELGGDSLEYHLQVSQGQLTRVYFVIRLPAADNRPFPAADRLTDLIEAATRTWEDDFVEAVAGLPSEQRGVEFSEAYQEATSPQAAVADLAIANQLQDDHDLRFVLRPPVNGGCDVRLTIFSLRPMELAQVMPHLSMLGVAVTDERPYEWQLRGRRVLLYDFGLRLPVDAPPVEDWDAASRARFVEAFDASWRGLLEARLFNRLVLTAGLTWQQVNWLRGISRYLQQAVVGFSQQYIAAALHANPGLAATLVRVFQVKFDPALFGDDEARAEALKAAEAELESRIDQVASLDHDRILRMFAAVIRATVRTNAFVTRDPGLRRDDGVGPGHSGTYSSHPGTYPSHPGTHSGHPGTYPSHPGTHSGHPGTYPSHPGTHSGHPGTYPSHPGTHSGHPGEGRDLTTSSATTDGAPSALAYKLLPRELALLPQPRPAYEVFVYSPRVQGVHLRFGKVARGGLRWSDRREDFRTEVLGLVKAQTVKNTVIVPVGAKGGFVPQRLPDPATDRAGWLAEGQACYRIFIDALLSVTDNSHGGVVEPPPGVVRYDGDDPYLVVAADKGTASFSDIANEISLERGFWLGDAFASGGSSGYDHKGMGITARGAWESVKHHFHELGLDPQNTDFTVAGIGDMSGDVFGNGMLASRRIRLVAAFDHRHIFLDPDPDAAVSYLERQRLFGLPRSSWADYDPKLISAGGGVHPRTAKRILLSAPVRRVLGLADSVAELSPQEMIRTILQAPVDLLYNGGIGTYVKGSGQTNAEVGDKANDAIRVNGAQVRARCAAEGGNLGWTQSGRIEYAAAGGRINTDFIDNSAGVDTSDHEVNLKVLLAAALRDHKLTADERDPLLASMTDEVAQLVLRHNVDQNLALSNSESRARVLAGQHEDWMRVLTEAGFLDRGLEDLPDSAAMAERIAAGRGLTRPELAVLLAYTKIALKEWVLAGDLPDDPYLADRLTSYFPQPVRERFAEQIAAHPLARQIITTVAVNRFVNSQGITAYHRLSTETGAEVADVIRAQLAARSIYNVGLAEVQLGRMDDLDAGLVTELRMELRRMVERATRWLLHNRRAPLDIRAAIEEFAEPVAQIRAELRERVTPRQSQAVEGWYRSWLERGAPEPLAASMATAAHAHYALGIAATARRLSADPGLAGEVFFTLGEQLGLDRLVEQIDVLPRQVRWDAMARAALRDELLEAQDDLTAAVLRDAPADRDAAGMVDAWLQDNPAVGGRIATLREVCEGEPDLARMSVGLGVVRSLLA